MTDDRCIRPNKDRLRPCVPTASYSRPNRGFVLWSRPWHLKQSFVSPNESECFEVPPSPQSQTQPFFLLIFWDTSKVFSLYPRKETFGPEKKRLEETPFKGALSCFTRIQFYFVLPPRKLRSSECEVPHIQPITTPVKEASTTLRSTIP
jgi:hypothetical protein